MLSNNQCLGDGNCEDKSQSNTLQQLIKHMLNIIMLCIVVPCLWMENLLVHSFILLPGHVLLSVLVLSETDFIKGS